MSNETNFFVQIDEYASTNLTTPLQTQFVTLRGQVQAFKKQRPSREIIDMKWQKDKEITKKEKKNVY